MTAAHGACDILFVSAATYRTYCGWRLLPCIPLTGTEIQDEMPDILETGLIEALSDSRYLKLIDMRLEDILRENEECNQCEHRLYCGGGCRATALDLQRPVYRD